jgi:hypothetical protein
VTITNARSAPLTELIRRQISEGISGIERIVRSERIRLPGLGHVGIDTQELVGGRVVVAPY